MDPELWQWIWLTATGFFILAEVAVAGSFFLLPFGVGTAASTILAFAGVDENWQWIAFLGVSVFSLASLRPLARKLNSTESPAKVGSTRLIGEIAVVTKDLTGDMTQQGKVQIGREEWPAETSDQRHVPSGTRVKVVQIEGTRAVVELLSDIQK